MSRNKNSIEFFSKKFDYFMIFYATKLRNFAIWLEIKTQAISSKIGQLFYGTLTQQNYY